MISEYIPRILLVMTLIQGMWMLTGRGNQSNASESYHLVNDSTVELTILEGRILIQVDTSVSGATDSLITRFPCISSLEIPPYPRGFVEFAISDSCSRDSLLMSLESDNMVNRVAPVYIGPDSSSMHPSDLVSVVFERDLVIDSCTSLMLSCGLQFVDSPYFMHNWWLCALDDTTSATALSCGNGLNGLPGVVLACADLTSQISFGRVDPLLANQYYIAQTAENDDLNILRAQSFLAETESLRVAIIDEGFVPHPDFPSWRFYGGKDVRFDDDDYSPGTLGDAHGMACMGILAASRDTIGILGVCPTVKIVPVRAFEGGGSVPASVSDNVWGKAINYAVSSGARVFSISVTTLSVAPKPITELAIKEAALPNPALGRDYGCTIVFNAGNEGLDPLKNMIPFPANMEEVIAVGALDRDGVRTTYSSYGPALDLMAFGGAVIFPSAEAICSGDIWTIDDVGIGGWNPTEVCESYELSADSNYMSGFSGTSAAAPQVAGVAAMLLSYRSDINYVQMREVLMESAVDIMTEGRDDQSGYGRVDAMRALACVARGDLTGEGDINILDVTRITNVVFRGAPCVPYHPSLADLNCDGVLNAQDVVEEVNVAFRSGAQPEIRTDCLDLTEAFSTCCLPPSAPTLRLPNNQSEGLPPEVTFDWWDEYGATGYFFFISDDQNFSNVIYSGPMTASEFTLSGFTPGSTLYWKLRATNTCGPGSFSNPWSFTVATEQ